MTRDVPVPLPDDDVTDGLTDADRERAQQTLTDHGFRITPEGRATFRERLAAADREWTPERRRELRERFGRVGRVA